MRMMIAIALALVACGPNKRDGNGNGSGSGSGSACTGRVCSADLHDVTDCDGNVIEQCADGLGCSNGACASGCEAASTSASSVGCDYYAVDPDSYLTLNGSCFAAYIANTWTTPVTINVEYDGLQLNVSQFARVPTGQGQSITYQPLTNGMLMPNQVAILFLAQKAPAINLPGLGYTPCPNGITPAYTVDDAAVHGTKLGKAFHITTDNPVTAYDIFPYGGGTSAITSATLLLPTPTWDINYVAVDAYRQSAIPDPDSGMIQKTGQPFVEILAKQDNTHVTIRPNIAIVGGTGVPAAAAGSNATYTLMAGQFVQLEQDGELMGSPITSDYPVGVWGGASCMNIPVDKAACDGAHQQIPPVKAMGSHYAAVRYRNRFPGVEESVPWRMVGGVDNTTLVYSPSAPAGAPATLQLGQVAEFNASSPFTVTSQDGDHPFYMSAHMTGCQDINDGTDCRGDPEFVNVVPPDQYLASYTFFTDPTYPETNLVLTREQVNGAFADVTIDCLGTITGWQPVDTAGTIQFARVDLVTGNFQSVGSCNNGLHIASSAQPFGMTVWGWGNASTGLFSTTYVSYAYPAGAAIKPINNVVIE